MSQDTQTPEIDDLTDEEIDDLRRKTYERAKTELNFSEEDAKLYSDTFAEAARKPDRR